MFLYSVKATPDDINPISVTAKGAEISVSFKGKSFTFSPSLMQFFPDIANLVFGVDGEFYLQWSSEAINDKSGFASALWRKRAPLTSSSIASFFAESEETVHVFTRLPVILPEGVDAIQVAPSLRAEEAFSQCSDLAKLYTQRAAAKRILLGKININDSLAMLEAQLDLLTHVVLNDDQAESSKAALQTAISGVDVMSIHSMDKLKETILRQKAHIRNNQKEYFKMRGELSNADLSS